MRLLPRDMLLIESPLTADDALARLKAATGPRKWFRLGRVPYELEGEVAGERVEVQRVIYYRTSFLPRVSAVVEPMPRGSRLRGTLSLHPLVIAFLVVWFGILIAAPVMILRTVPDGGTRGLFLLGPVAFLLVVWLLVVAAFSYEASRARKLLAALLAAEAIPPAEIARS